MQVLFNLVLGLQIVAALAIIGLVLVQHGKGADMGASFGTGSAGSLFGASGSANFLSRATAVAATVFFVCTLALAYSAHRNSTGESSGSVLDRAAAPQPVASNPVGAAQIPGAASAAASQPAIAASGAAAIPTK